MNQFLIDLFAAFAGFQMNAVCLVHIGLTLIYACMAVAYVHHSRVLATCAALSSLLHGGLAVLYGLPH